MWCRIRGGSFWDTKWVLFISGQRGWDGKWGGVVAPLNPSFRVVKKWVLLDMNKFQDKLKMGGEGPIMLDVEGGKFLMGNNEGWLDERPAHEVDVESFAMSEACITFDEYDAYCKATGRELVDDSGFGRGSRPVINVSWHDAKAYCDWLSDQTGERYRLPTEEEWEYACRAGTTTRYFFGDSDEPLSEYAWFYDNSNGMTHPVKTKLPNGWGFYDMLGNVWEWCETEYIEYENKRNSV